MVVAIFRLYQSPLEEELNIKIQENALILKLKDLDFFSYYKYLISLWLKNFEKGFC